MKIYSYDFFVEFQVVNELVLDIEIAFGHTMKIYEDRRQMIDNLIAIEAASYKIIDTNPARGMLVFFILLGINIIDFLETEMILLLTDIFNLRSKM